ncbi:protein-disulfide reductase DsbD N-terminal domain-containing protein [Lishizhenia sp.]|uniref:protein-disulfide reductase DsbD N-terminal domain-containing protein n=1 Tax=Lishizhenia sp. TaxID=2497594 RepID=UPI00299F26A3|nr:protein-disulfide reductase DsbD N-terminal domain-containing protein [Lishizhenia sp.]MDX1445784.1 protein-disulfide reductase DsbD N-terminal domain-containing protein [Lishizhenia sp.]
MIKLLSIFALLLSSVVALGQDKVTWTANYNAEDSTIVLHADIAEGWHLYSQNLENDMGPIPTEITFSPNELVTFSEETIEPEPKQSFDENFGANLSYFEKSVDFTNKIIAQDTTTVNITVMYMICNDEMCLPPTEKTLTITINKPLN